LVGITIFLTLFERLYHYKSPIQWDVLVFTLIGGPLIVNRTDIFFTIGRGRWWWKEEKFSNEF